MAGTRDPGHDGTVDMLIERLEQSLARSTGIVRLIQKHVDESEQRHWERVNEILYQVHSAVRGEWARRTSSEEG